MVTCLGRLGQGGQCRKGVGIRIARKLPGGYEDKAMAALRHVPSWRFRAKRQEGTWTAPPTQKVWAGFSNTAPFINSYCKTRSCRNHCKHTATAVPVPSSIFGQNAQRVRAQRPRRILRQDPVRFTANIPRPLYPYPPRKMALTPVPYN